MGRTQRARRATRAWAPLLGLAMITAGLGAAALPTADAAGTRPPTVALTVAGPGSRLVAATRPTAIGVDRHGTSYVAFATGGALVRMSAQGKRRHPVPLDQDGPVHAVFTTANGNIWVHYGTSVSLLKPGGAVLQHFGEDLAAGCADGGQEPARYGGIAATRTTVYVASGCDATVHVYSHDGRLRTVVRLPGRGIPRGIAYGPAQHGRPARLFVAQPGRGRLLAYDAGRLRGSSHPIGTVQVRRPRGGFRPVPAGVVADDGGQVVVSDTANNALYFYDSNHRFSLYRTLGHPPRRSGSDGRLNHPAGLAQHAQDGGSLSGNLFIADSDNHRVQRWDTGGYTHWAKRVHAPAGSGGGSGNSGGTGGGTGGAGAPVSTEPPQVTGTPAVGRQLGCSTGSWTRSPTSYTRLWLRDGSGIAGTDRATYDVVAADAGRTLSCRVRATNAQGTSAWEDSDVVSVGGGSSSLQNLTPPTISGTATLGQTLTCSPGTWSGTPTFFYAWLRAGTRVGSGQTYEVQGADVGQPLVCVVTASAGPSGSGEATSAPVTPTGSVTPPSGTCAGPVGVSINDGAASTTAAAVTLRIRPGSDVTTVTISNDGGFVPASTVPVTAGCAYAWTLQAADLGTPLPRRVYVRFGSETVTYTDDIVLNQTRARNAPVGP